VTLPIVQTGDPVLRQGARDLTREEILSDSIQNLVVLMRDTMRAAPGVGLAAPQIGQSLQLAVIEDPVEYLAGVPAEELSARLRSPVDFHVIINPKLTVVGDSTAEFFEGCLSVDGFQAVVRRAFEVRVECLNERAEQITINAKGWYARILQHEIDHLNGRLYIDRMNPQSVTTNENLVRFGKGD
jgi:peptide deformylase